MVPIPAELRTDVLAFCQYAISIRKTLTPEHNSLIGELLVAYDNNHYVFADRTLYQLAWRNPVWHHRAPRDDRQSLIELAGELRERLLAAYQQTLEM